MEDATVTKTVPIRNRELHANKTGVMASWHEGGQQFVRTLPWAGNLTKTVTVNGKPITLAQIRDGLLALYAALETDALT